MGGWLKECVEGERLSVCSARGRLESNCPHLNARVGRPAEEAEEEEVVVCCCYCDAKEGLECSESRCSPVFGKTAG